MKKMIACLVVLWVFGFFISTSSAHFGMVIPSDSMVMQRDNRVVKVAVSFSHPFERVGMKMEKPKAFGVVVDGDKRSLLNQLKEIKVMANQSWQVDYQVNRPGLYVFFVEPKPYWEPAEDCFIIHYTKTVVTAFGNDRGWDEEIGLKTEIVPVSKPFGLYAGNTFQGVVILDGKPVAHAEVEVEYYNEDGGTEAPTDYMVTQTVKADSNGLFTYAAPSAGWWGFSALNRADYQLKHGGEDKDVELGAVIWVRFHDWNVKADVR